MSASGLQVQTPDREELTPSRLTSTIAMVGSYVPRLCGIATFSHDLCSALAENIHHKPLGETPCIRIAAINDREQTYAYHREVIVEIHQHRKEDYRNAAAALNNSKVDVVHLQHEYGLFGGEEGEYVLELLDRLRKPLVTTLHTVLTEPTPKQAAVLLQICEQSYFLVVMADRARTILHERYGVPRERIRVIAHGVPDIPFGDAEPFKERFCLAGRPVVLTFGLLVPAKSIETMLDALAQVTPDHPDLAYIILGVTHPAAVRDCGESYRLSLERRVVELGIEKNVLFHNRYVSLEDLREYLQAADIYVTPYRNKDQITSGTLAYALACGKAIISTPYWYAQELLAGGRGLLANFGSADDFAMHLRDLLEHEDKRETIRRAAYDFGRNMVWPRVAQQYSEVYRQARQTFSEAPRDQDRNRKLVMRLTLPKVRLKHLFTLTDDTGILQHALYTTPNRAHGYCTDDNARALLVASMVWSLLKDESVLAYLHTYLSFLHHAMDSATGRFRVAMSFDRRWVEQKGSEDCQGRSLWALGYLASHAANSSLRELARELFLLGIGQAESLKSPRGWTFSILGLYYFLRAFPDEAGAGQTLLRLADRFERGFQERVSDDWPWLEDTVTYDNGRIPQSLIIAGLSLDRPALVEHGLALLQWLFDIQAAPQGHLTVIGNRGWLHRNKEPAHYDQQPLEPAALIGACKAAYKATSDTKWLIKMREAFAWYLGRNDAGTPMVDFQSHGCYDGLQPDGINQNEGAEAVLSWLLSLLIMHEMQTGETLEVG